MSRDSIDDYVVQVDHDPTVGIRVTLFVVKVPFVSTFGDLPTSRERALSTANRLANELGIVVRDKLPKNHDIVQAKYYQPDIPIR